MALVTTPAIVLSAIRYSETSKIVRLATRDYGMQSAIAKGALRPRSRFGASLQILSEGVAHLVMHQGRELHLLTAFDVGRVPVGLTEDLERYAAAAVLAEVMLRFSPPDPHPESYDRLRHGLLRLATVEPADAEAEALRSVWLLVSSLGFAPELAECVRDGSSVEPDGDLPFSTREGGALCAACGREFGATRLPLRARRALLDLLDPDAAPPALNPRDARAHRRLVARFVRFHLGDGVELPALEFWERRPWLVR